MTDRKHVGEVSVGAFLRVASAALEAAEVDSPLLSAQLILCKALKCERIHVLVEQERILAPEERREAEALLTRRFAGEPVAYLLGNKEFYGRDFSVSPEVLIPRPDTEHIIEHALEFFSPDQAFHFADFGTGSGILAVTLALEFSASTGLALDISPGALAMARENAAAHDVGDRVLFTLGDLASPPLPPGSLDLLVSNPPYVSEAEYQELSHEIMDYEPRGALVPEPESEGLEAYRTIAASAHRLLRPGGVVLLEIGWKQGEAVRDLFSEHKGWAGVEVHPDLAGRPRVVVCRAGV